MPKTKTRARAKTATTATRSSKKRASKPGLDSVYFLKLLLYIIVGAQWLRFSSSTSVNVIPIPVGLIIGLIFAAHEHFKIDRKIEYAVLLVAMLVGYFSQSGFFITY